MSEIALTNSNILVETHIPSESRDARRQRLGALRLAGATRAAADPHAAGQLAAARRQVGQVVCSSVWEEDCLYRGKDYAPDFACACRLCRGEFPKRLYPRGFRQSEFSQDCQVECEEDPEFAEEFARLRNDRARAGSVFVSSRREDRGTGASRRAQPQTR